jgi:uncharacterized protein (DUF2252 family)
LSSDEFRRIWNSERDIIFDINDFDETLPAPGMGSKEISRQLVVAGRNNGFKEAESRKAALRCIQSYHEHMPIRGYGRLGDVVSADGMWSHLSKVGSGKRSFKADRPQHAHWQSMTFKTKRQRWQSPN